MGLDIGKFFKSVSGLGVVESLVTGKVADTYQRDLLEGFLPGGWVQDAGDTYTSQADDDAAVASAAALSVW